MTDNYTDWKDWRPDDFGKFTPHDARYFRWHVARATGGRQNKLVLLEVGFGNGAFMGWAKSEGHTILGVEANVQLVERALSAGHRASLGVPDMSQLKGFDAIVGFDVLEHIRQDELVEFLSKLAGHLVADGTMLFRFPNAQSPLGCLYQEGDLTHVSRISVRKLEQICNELGLEVVHIGEPLPWPRNALQAMPGAFATALLRRLIEAILRRVSGGETVSVNPNEVTVLRRPASVAR